MFASFPLSPREEVNAFIEAVNDARRISNEAAQNHTGAEAYDALRLLLNALIRSTREMIDVSTKSTLGVKVADLNRCIILEARVSAYRYDMGRDAALPGRNWPDAVRRIIENKSVSLLDESDKVVVEIRAMIERHC